MTQKHATLRYNRVPFHTAEGEDILQRVEAHWETIRKSSPVPARMTLSPDALDAALSHCFVLERVAPTIARFRVAGQALSTILGMEARSMPLSAVFTADGRDTLGPLINAVCEGPEIVEIPLTATRGLARGPVRGRLLLLPLTDQDGDISRIFGAIVLDGKPGRRALRFDVDQALPLRCKRLTPMIRTIHEVKTQMATADYHDDFGDTHAPAPQFRRPHLRLVVNNS